LLIDKRRLTIEIESIETIDKVGVGEYGHVSFNSEDRTWVLSTPRGKYLDSTVSLNTVNMTKAIDLAAEYMDDPMKRKA
jgi:hypothetical protein